MAAWATDLKGTMRQDKRSRGKTKQSRDVFVGGWVLLGQETLIDGALEKGLETAEHATNKPKGPLEPDT